MKIIKKTIKQEEIYRFFKFAVVGGIGAVIQFIFWKIFNNIFGISSRLALAISIEIAIISNFLLNNIWTFKDRGRHGNAFFKFLKFNLVSLGGLLIQLIVYTILTERIGLYKDFAVIFGILAGMFWNFFINNFWTWRKNK